MKKGFKNTFMLSHQTRESVSASSAFPPQILQQQVIHEALKSSDERPNRFAFRADQPQKEGDSAEGREPATTDDAPGLRDVR